MQSKSKDVSVIKWNNIGYWKEAIKEVASNSQIRAASNKHHIWEVKILISIAALIRVNTVMSKESVIIKQLWPIFIAIAF